jgi:hypothetical protein
MQWVRENLFAAIASLAGALFVLWKSGILQWALRTARTLITAFRETTLKNSQRECEALKVEKKELEAVLEHEVRKNLAFGDINKQDRATIRTLVSKIDAHNAAHFNLADDRLCLIDYSDLYEEIKRALMLQ